MSHFGLYISKEKVNNFENIANFSYLLKKKIIIIRELSHYICFILSSSHIDEMTAWSRMYRQISIFSLLTKDKPLVTQSKYVHLQQSETACRPLLNRPQCEFGHLCTSRCSRLTRHATRSRTCLFLLCVTLNPLNKIARVPVHYQIYNENLNQLSTIYLA